MGGAAGEGEWLGCSCRLPQRSSGLPRGHGETGLGDGSLRVPAHGVSLPAVGIEGRVVGRKLCQIQIRTELLSSSLPMVEAK